MKQQQLSPESRGFPTDAHTSQALLSVDEVNFDCLMLVPLGRSLS